MQYSVLITDSPTHKLYKGDYKYTQLRENFALLLKYPTFKTFNMI